jgi:hypothetical protein
LKVGYRWGLRTYATHKPKIVVGGTLVYISQKVCSAHYSTITAELSSVKDPPRPDYGVLALIAAPVAG